MYALANYNDRLVRSAITANKFYASTKAADLLAELLHEYLKQQTTENSLWLVPVPLGKERLRERGYNQVEVILKRLKHDNWVIMELLERTHETTPQTKLKRAERLKNMTGAFGARHNLPTPPPGTHVIIIDDVTTTGATLKAARAAIAPHLPRATRLTCVALAH